MTTNKTLAAAPGVVGRIQWQWKCDNCGAWVDDDGSGNDHDIDYCRTCGSYADCFGKYDKEATADGK